MLCRNPYLQGKHMFPCGQCLPCRFNRRRIWTHRIMLEASMYKDNAFVTLTLSDDYLQYIIASRLATLVPADLSLFLKRLRKALAPMRIRFYAVGEYGDTTERPHYHLAIFGMPTCARGNTSFNRDGHCCDICDLVDRAWGKGRVFLGDLSVHSAQYVSGYVVKKLTGSDVRLEGREPEFSRMSLRPGIGADFMHEVASSILEHNLEELEDVPSSLRHGSRNLPLGRYLRRRLRTLVGRAPDTPQAVLDKMAEEVRPLREAAFDASRSVKAVSLEVNLQRYRQFTARSRLYDKGKDKL